MRVQKVSWRKNSTDYYREDWFPENRKVALACWNEGPLPYGTLLWPRYYSEVKRTGGGWFRFENNADLTFEYLLSGTLRYTQDGVTESVAPGEVYLMHPGADVVFHTRGGESFHRLRLMICGTLVRELDLQLHLTGCNCFRLSDPGPFLARIRTIAERMEQHRAEDAPEISSMVYRLIAGFAAECGNSRIDTLPDPLARILREMRENFSIGFTIRELAEEHGMEVHQLMRLFQRHFGVSPLEYRNKLRMEAAGRLVAHSSLPMKEIAERLGYRSPLYFSTAFRRTFGLSPSRYRLQNRESWSE